MLEMLSSVTVFQCMFNALVSFQSPWTGTGIYSRQGAAWAQCGGVSE